MGTFWQILDLLYDISVSEFSNFVFVEIKNYTFLWPINFLSTLLATLCLFLPFCFTHVGDVLILNCVLQSMHLIDWTTLSFEHDKDLFSTCKWLFTLDSFGQWNFLLNSNPLSWSDLVWQHQSRINKANYTISQP